MNFSQLSSQGTLVTQSNSNQCESNHIHNPSQSHINDQTNSKHDQNIEEQCQIKQIDGSNGCISEIQQMQVREEQLPHPLEIKMPPIQYSPFLVSNHEISHLQHGNQEKETQFVEDTFNDRQKGVPDNNKDFKVNNNKSFTEVSQEIQESTTDIYNLTHIFNIQGSLFYKLNHPSLQIKQRSQLPCHNDNFKRNLTPLHYQYQGVPSIKEWFSFLSEEDKQLSLSIVNQKILDHIINMILKMRHKGQGFYKLERQGKKKMSGSSGSEGEAEGVNSNDDYKFKYKSLKSLIDSQQELYLISNTNSTEKQAHHTILEKEFLEFVRFTWSEPRGSTRNMLVQNCVNTLSIKPSIISDKQDLFEYFSNIAGHNILKIPNQFQYDKQGTLTHTSFPIWLETKKHLSLSKWILFFYEISLWHNFNIFTKDLEQEKNQKTINLLLKENQLIDFQNRFYEIILQLKTKHQQAPSTFNEKVFQQLNSQNGLSLTMLQTLFFNQESKVFTQELCMTSIQKIDSDLFDTERQFLNLVSELLGSTQSANQKTLKNQKKKNKRKLKKQDSKNQQLVKKSQSQGSEQLISIRKQSLNNIPISERIKKAHINEHNKEEINSLLENIIKDVEENKEVTKIREAKEEKETSQCYDVFSEENFNLLQLLEMNNDMHEVEEAQGMDRRDKLEKISAFSDSTEDILGNFSSENFKNQLKSPQASTNTEIDLTMRKNLFSSEAGDSSIQLQKQFSDFYMKDISHQNIDMNNQTKTKESIDNLVVDVSISNEYTTKQDESIRNGSSSKRVQLQLPSSSPQYEEEEKSFQIIRSSHTFQQEQQNQRQNQKKKKKSKRKPQGSGNQAYNQSQQQKVMNNFIREIHYHQDQDENYDDYCDEDQDFQDEQHLRGCQDESKQRPIYVKKSNSGNDSSEAQDFQKPSNSFKNTSSSNMRIGDLPSQPSFFTSSDSQKKKKSYTKQKKTTNNGWDKNNKKKSSSKTGKSQTQQQSNLGQMNQNCYDQATYNQNLGHLNQRSQSMYDSPYHQYIDPIFMNGQLDIDNLKQNIQKIIIQDQIAQQQQQQSQLQMQRAYSEQQNYHSNDFEDEYDDEDKEQKVMDQFFDMLETQMIMFQKGIEKKLESVRKEREEAIKIIRRIVEGLYQDERNSVTIKQYGSMASNLAIDTSDVDLAVVGLEFGGSKDRQLSQMRRLIEQIQLHMKKYTAIKFIEQATVPVIKLEIDLVQIARNLERNQKNDLRFGGMQKSFIDESMRYLGVDITFDDTKPKQHFYGQYVENNSRINLGVKCINYIKESCKNQSGLQTIVLVLKKLLQINDLNQTFTGGLNSYSIVLMTSAYLRQYENVSQMSMNLMEFFNFYGSYYDPKTTIISSHVSPHYIKAQNILNEHIIIIDPLDSGNNPSRGAYQIQKIQEVLKMAYSILQECLNQFKQDQREIDLVKLLMRKVESLNTFGLL